MLAGSLDNTIRFYDTSNLNLIEKLDFTGEGKVFWISFNKTDSLFIVSGKNDIFIYNTLTKEKIISRKETINILDIKLHIN